jgi:hypothetical protein
MRVPALSIASFCALTLAFGGTRAASQETPPSGTEVGVALAAASQQWRDEVLNPLRHSGWSPTLDVYRVARAARWRSLLDLQLAFGPVATRFDPGRDSFAAGFGLAYERLRRAAAMDDGTELWLGGRLEGGSELAFFGLWDDSHFYWLTSYGVDIAGSLNRRWGGGRTLDLEWNAPLLALVSRPAAPILYKAQDPSFSGIVRRLHDRMRLTSLHEHRAVDVTLRFTRGDATFARSLFLRAEYSNTDVPGSQRLQILRQSLGLTVAW